MRHFTIISRFTMVSLSLCLMIQTWAGPVDKQQARQFAEQFMQKRGMTLQTEPRRVPGRDTAEKQPVYIFNTENQQGFVIVAGDDRAETILGYTEHGSYDENNLPDNFRAWLEATAAEIEALGKMSDAKALQKVPTHAPIAPMIQSKWSQGTPYNSLCPIINGEHCITGCVPTAGAQLMYYYQWPQQPTKALPGYGSGNGTSTGLSPTSFKWDKMKDTYSYDDEGTESGQAVAELMLYCGYAAQVSYGLSASGASTWTLAHGMVDYFDYDPNTMRDVERNNYSISDWDALIYNELAGGRPVLFSGFDPVSGIGHAFICDGYDGDGFFSFNFGWGGLYDFHFKLHATQQFIGDQSAIIGLQPNNGIHENYPYSEDVWEEETVEGITGTVGSLDVTDGFFSFNFTNYNETTETFGMGLGELLPDGSLTVVNDYYNYMVQLETNWGLNISFPLSQLGLSPGTHTIVPICKRDGEPEWKRCNPLSLFIIVTVGNDGSINAVVHPLVNLSISNFTVINGNDDLLVSYDVTNENEEANFEGSLFVWLDDYPHPWSEPFKIKPGNTKTCHLHLQAYPEEGQHTVRLCANYDKDVLATNTFTYQRLHLSASAFDFPDCRLKGINQRVKVTVECTGGEYVGPLFFFVSQTDDMGEFVYYNASAIEQNGSEEQWFDFTPDKDGLWNVWICKDKEGTDIIGQGTVNIGSLKATVFNVTGNRHARQLQQVDVSIQNTGGKYQGLFTLWVSKSDDFDNAAKVISEDITLAEGSVTAHSFSFYPDDTGEWFLWLTNGYYQDKDAIIGKSSVDISTLKATDFALTGNGHVKNEQEVAITIENPVGEYQGELTLYICKTDNFDEAYSFGGGKEVILPQESVTSQTFTFYPNETGEWHLWLAMGSWWDKVAIGHATVDIGTLKATDIALARNGHVKNYQDVEVTINNPKGKYQGDIYLIASKSDDFASYYYWDKKEVSISAQSDSVVTLQFYANEIGEWHLWAATGWDEKDIIGHATVDIGSLKATDFEVTGTLFANWEQQLDVTVENPKGDYQGDIILLASKTNDWSSISWWHSQEVSISAQSESTITLPFTPDSSGEWYIWAATSGWDGYNIIGNASVHIIDAPEGEIQLTLLDKAVQVEGTTATLTLQLKNTGELTSYKGLYTYIFEVTPEEYIYLRSQETPEVIEPGETKELNIVYDNLGKDKTYCVYINYYSSLVSPWDTSYLGDVMFSMTDTQTGIRGVISDDDDEGWYTLDGLKLENRPSKRGVYIHKGRKVMLNIR